MKKLLLIISINVLNLNSMHIYDKVGSYPPGQTSRPLKHNPFSNTRVDIVPEDNSAETKHLPITINTHFNKLKQHLAYFMLEGDTKKLTLKKIHTYQGQDEKIISIPHNTSHKLVIGFLFLSPHFEPHLQSIIESYLHKTDNFIQVSGPLSRIYENTYYSIENNQFSKYYGQQIAHTKIPLFLYLKTSKQEHSLSLTVSIEDYLGYTSIRPKESTQSNNNNNNQISSHSGTSSISATIPQLTITSPNNSYPQLPYVSSLTITNDDQPPALETIPSTEDKK